MSKKNSPLAPLPLNYVHAFLPVTSEHAAVQNAPDAPGESEVPEPPVALVDADRKTLRQWMRVRRLAVSPALTQLALSRLLGHEYSIVAGWESGTRALLATQFQRWAQVVGVAPEEAQAVATAWQAAFLAEEKMGIASGSRMDAEVNARAKWLRKQLRLSLRELADLTGISSGHLQRVEVNTSNLSVAQVRALHQQLGVSYAWLIDGVGSYNEPSLLDRLAQLERENELLENLRQAQRMHK